MFKNRVLLITGGTGSFGKSVLKRFISEDFSEIRIFSRDENKQEHMRIEFNHPKLKFYIGDIRDYDSLYVAMTGVDYVFHAAALKQVPSCEFYPLEAVRTNVLGSENVINAGVARGVKRIIMLSTDKAVYPTNAMGISKSMMEKIMIAKSRLLNDSDTILCATRYGNVMGSRGSVIPLLLNQLKNDMPLTITDPNMTRFMMSLEDSVNLVLHAFEHGKQGDIFVQKSSACRVIDLANALKELAGKENKINIIGTRHGEKLYETLVSREEMIRVEDIDCYYRIPADNRDLNYAQYYSEGEIKVSLQEDYTSHNTDRLNITQLKALLSQLQFIKRKS